LVSQWPVNDCSGEIFLIIESSFIEYIDVTAKQIKVVVHNGIVIVQKTYQKKRSACVLVDAIEFD